MALTSPRLRRLDDALIDLAVDGDVMLLSELDGYLAGIAVGVEPITEAEWLPSIWSRDGEPAPFADEEEAIWYAGLARGHLDAVRAALAKGRYAPFLEIDPRHDEVMWEVWIEGLARAAALRPDEWRAEHATTLEERAAIEGLVTLIAVARDESDLERAAIDDLTDRAPDLIAPWIAALHARSGPRTTESRQPLKVGRNEPCPCGSGRKHKRCCGAG